MKIDTVQMRGDWSPFVVPPGAAAVVILTLFWAGPRLVAQEDPGARPDTRNRRASAIHEPCIPTEDDNAPDVFQRPCFVDALRFSRQFAPVHGLTRVRGGVKLADEAIPTALLEALRGVLGWVLTSDYIPVSWAAVKVDARASCPLKTISEMRNGVPTFVRQEYDCTGVTALKDGDGIQTGWTIDGMDVLPRMQYGPTAPKKVVIRLRLYGDDRLTIRPRPQDWDALGARREFFDRAVLHEFLTSVFRVPFESSDDFLVEGYDAEYEGVRVFHGKIWSRDWWVEHFAEKSRKPSHWWDEMRLLVTDSDPQYFCVEIVLREGDALDAP